MVFSTRTRFSQEEESAILSLQTLFGSKIFDYMIVVFTGGDDFEENDETLDDYLGRDCPEPLKVTKILIFFFFFFPFLRLKCHDNITNFVPISE